MLSPCCIFFMMFFIIAFCVPMCCFSRCVLAPGSLNVYFCVCVCVCMRVVHRMQYFIIAVYLFSGQLTFLSCGGSTRSISPPSMPCSTWMPLYRPPSRCATGKCFASRDPCSVGECRKKTVEKNRVC